MLSVAPVEIATDNNINEELSVLTVEEFHYYSTCNKNDFDKDLEEMLGSILALAEEAGKYIIIIIINNNIKILIKSF